MSQFTMPTAVTNAERKEMQSLMQRMFGGRTEIAIVPEELSQTADGRRLLAIIDKAVKYSMFVKKQTVMN